MADSIEVLFKMWTQVDPRNHVLDGAHIPPGEVAIFWMGRGAPMMQPFVKIPWPFVLCVTSHHFSSRHYVYIMLCYTCLQCFDAVAWAAGRASGCKKLSGGVLAWLSVWSEVRTCIWPSWCHLPLTVSCFSKIQIGFTFLVPAHLGSPGQRAVKRVCVCVYAMLYMCVFIPSDVAGM